MEKKERRKKPCQTLVLLFSRNTVVVRILFSEKQILQEEKRHKEEKEKNQATEQKELLSLDCPAR